MFKPVCVLVALATTFSSCQKILDYYNYKENETPTGCQVKKISTTVGEFVNTTRVTYNSKGQPSAVMYERYDGAFDLTETYTFNYAYDNLGRLISETSDFVYGGEQIYYAYEGNSTLPARDTVIALYESFVEDLEYDNNGRIIKKTRRDFEFVIPEDNPGPHPDEVYKYYYDIRGNRQQHMSNIGYKGVIQYSDKPSLYSTNPVWQLIHKDYSKNSVPYGEAFNGKGLPLTVKSKVDYLQPFLDLYLGSKVEYECE